MRSQMRCVSLTRHAHRFTTFWAVRELLEDWNKHMEDVFHPGHTV